VTRYVALLRGINVGAHAQLPMSALREAFASAGYPDATTLLRSGNVVFTGPRTPEHTAIEERIAAATGVRPRVTVLTATRFRAVVEGNPLLEVSDDPSRLGVGFLDGPPPPGLEAPEPATLAPERMVISDVAVYQWCPLGFSKSRVPAAFWRQLGAGVTTRNHKTCLRILTAL
jgi:uncharacterized protein (DUF1697 family)